MNSDLYVIGDVHGCFDALTGLLEQIDPKARVVFVGDIINRGPRSLDCLRLIRAMTLNGRCAGSVLGNHDLHFLATAANVGKPHRKDTLSDILNAPDAQELIDWVRTRPLMLEIDDTLFVHAAIPPEWSLENARTYSSQVQSLLSSDKWQDAMAHMYGSDFNIDSDDWAVRMRTIVNGFTRVRYLDKSGQPDFGPKVGPHEAPKNVTAWFDVKRKIKQTICFGHWSTLGLLLRPDLIALDTGCVWGGCLSAVRLSDRRIFTEQCPQWVAPSC